MLQQATCDLSLSPTTFTCLCPDMPHNHIWLLLGKHGLWKNGSTGINTKTIITNNNCWYALNILLKVHRVWQLFQI